MRPSVVPLPFVEEITDYFSEEHNIGSGGYGEVYRGVLRNGTEIAVKKLYHMPGLDDKQFKNEFGNLMRVKHRNIVRLIAYCNEVRQKLVEHEGEHIFCKMVYRVLCFEYMPRGSLDKHLYDESHGFDWGTRYKIIKGICEGLNYLHAGLKEPIFHLDLKPANVLLDKKMVPKIADFGLSRLFRGTRTHTTKVCIGTEYYMPPEYIFKRQISNKYDIFSLGIIIIQIISGERGYSEYGVMSSPEQFKQTVQNNWRSRLVVTSKFVEEECYQVKRCIEIALSCVQADRHNRPAIRDIIHELKQTETNFTASSSWNLQAKVAKIGLWGGIGGSHHHDIEIEPYRLERLKICSDEVIYSLEFLYSDHSGQQHIAGPWGGNGPSKGSNRHVIQLGPAEYLLDVSGTIGPFGKLITGVITSLTFITNAGSYGPFGEVQGRPFKIPVQSNGSIVGFFARTGWYVDAIGVYVNPRQQTIDGGEVGLVKVGPWGGNGGSPRDIVVTPHRLDSVTIHSNVVVNSLQFSYFDRDGHKHTAGPWGGLGGTAFTVELGPSEFLKGIYGTTVRLDNASGDDVVSSLTLVTNMRCCGPFGQGGGTTIQIPMSGTGSIVGFFGTADAYVNTVGVYAYPQDEATEQQDVLMKIGPCGGTGGKAHDIDHELGAEPHHLVSVTVHYADVVNSLEFAYSDRNGNLRTVGPWGAPGGDAYTIQFAPLASLQGISGTYGPFGSLPNVITSLIFATDQGHFCTEPYGKGGGTPFVASAELDSGIVGFFGRAGSCLEAIGIYTRAH